MQMQNYAKVIKMLFTQKGEEGAVVLLAFMSLDVFTEKRCVFVEDQVRTLT